MNSELSSAIKSALSKILPDLVNLLQHYQIARCLELRLIEMGRFLMGVSQLPHATSLNETVILCTYWDWSCRCWKFCNPLIPGLDPEKARQFCEDVASKLDQVMSPLDESIPPSDKSYEVHLLLAPTTVISDQPMVCEWSSDTSQDYILKCSNP